MSKHRVQNKNKKVRTNGLDRTARGLEAAKPKISENQRPAVADREKISPHRERSTAAQSQKETKTNRESIRTKNRSSSPRSNGPLRSGETDALESIVPSEARLATFGTSDGSLCTELLLQVTRALPNVEPHDPDGKYALSALNGIGPHDTLEAMLAAQMVAVHNQAMELIRRAALPMQPPGGMERYMNLATKLERTFIAQVEALDRHRGKSEQKINVEHVHIRNGKQEIVGAFSHQEALYAAAEDHGKAN